MSELTFLPESHTYLLDDVVIPSVSKVLEVVAGKVPTLPHIMKAARFGTKVHHLTSLVDTGVPDEFRAQEEDDEKAALYVEQWENAKKVNGYDKMKLVGVEVALAHELLEFAGTIDRIYLDESSNTLHIVDIKTGKPYPKHGIQLAAYELLVTENLDVINEKTEIIRACVYLRADAHATRVFDSPTDAECFDGCLSVYKWQVEVGMRVQGE